MPDQISAKYDAKMCDSALARAFDFLGKRWNGLILGTLKTGSAGLSELRRAVSGISDSVLSERLTELAGAGIVERTVDDGPPVSVSYRLFASGLECFPRLTKLRPGQASTSRRRDRLTR